MSKVVKKVLCIAGLIGLFVFIFSGLELKESIVFDNQSISEAFHTNINYDEKSVNAVVLQCEEPVEFSEVTFKSCKEGIVNVYISNRDNVLFNYKFNVYEGINKFILPGVVADALRIDFVENLSDTDLNYVELTIGNNSEVYNNIAWLTIVLILAILFVCVSNKKIRVIILGCLLIVIAMNGLHYVRNTTLIPMQKDEVAYDINDIYAYSQGLEIKDDKLVKTGEVAWFDLCFFKSASDKVIRINANEPLETAALCFGDGDAFYEIYEYIAIDKKYNASIAAERSIARIYLDGEAGTTYCVQELIIENNLKDVIEVVSLLCMYLVAVSVWQLSVKYKEKINKYIQPISSFVINNLGVILGGILFLYYAYGCWNYSQPYMHADEMGYWSHAATLVGYDWSNVLQVTQIPWYSYGYSLILAILMFFLKETQFVYIGAVLVNALLIILSYCKLISILNKLNATNNKVINTMISFVVMLYPSFYFQSRIAWSEILLYTVVLCVFDNVLKYFQDSKTSNLVIATVSLAIMYVIHNRTIAIVIAFSVVLMMFAYKKDRKHLLIYAVVLVLLLGLYEFGKDWLVAKEFGDIGVSGNSIGSTLSRLFSMPLKESIPEFFRTYLGQMWYLYLGSLSTFFWGLWFCVKMFVCKYKEKATENYFYIFLVLLFLGQSLVSALFMTNGIDFSKEVVRIDPVMYGRYNESFIAIFMALGLVYLLQERVSKQNIIVGSVLFACFYGSHMIILDVVEKAGRITINAAAVVATYMCTMIGPYIIFENFIYIVLFVLVLVGIIWAVKKYNDKYKYIILAAFVLVFTNTAVVSSEGIAAVHYNKGISEEREVFDYIKENCEDTEINTSISDLFFLFDMQTWLYDKSVTCINFEAWEQSNLDSCIVIPRENIDLNKSYEIMFTTEKYVVIRKDAR